MKKKKSSKIKWWPTTNDINDGNWRNITIGILAVIVGFFIYFSFNTGPNGDDLFQNHYADHIIDYYTSLGKDTSVLYHRQGPIKYYGGLYEFSTAVVNEALGYDNMDTAYHRVRHLINSYFAFIAILAMVILTMRIVNWRAAAIVAFIFLCSPVFMHHGAMNPKDIPFATGVALSLLAMWNWFKRWPAPNWKSSIYLGLAIGVALAVRIGGLLLIGFLGVFALVQLFYMIWKKTFKLSSFGKLVLHGLVALIISFIVCILFWPYALEDPITHIIESFKEFNKFQVGISVLFGGENIMSEDTSPWYTPIWMIKTIPLMALAGFVLAIAFAKSLLKRIGTFSYAFLMFTALFPLFYLMYQNSNVYDAWRHSTFIYLPIAAISGIGIDTIWKKFMPFGKKTYYIIPAIIGLLAIHPLLHMLRYPGYAYVYFNILNNRPAQVTGYYETDYWGLSVEQAVDWMEEEGILHPGMEQLNIATHMYYGLRVALRSRGYGKEQVKTTYVKYRQRYNKKWDYGIFPARFIDAGVLKAGTYPDSYAIKTFYVDGSPITTILKNDEDSFYRMGNNAMKSGNTTQAIEYFQQELDKHPDNILAVRKLGSLYLNTNQFNTLQSLIKKYKSLNPGSDIPFIYEGIMYMRQGKGNRALASFENALNEDKNSFQALYYKAAIQSSQNNNSEAIELLRQVLEINSRFKPAYAMLARIYKKMGDKERARKYQQIANRL